MIALDTHILLFALLGEPLTAREKRVLGKQEPWSIAAIVLWEIAMLVKKKRVSLNFDDSATRQALARVHVWPLTLEIARAATALDFQSDPADELIAATSLVHAIPLLTRDKRIRASKRVPLA